MGGTGEGARETVPRPWRMRGILSSFATGTDRFLEHARFDRGPWLVVAFASGIGLWFFLAAKWQWTALIAIALAVAVLGYLFWQAKERRAYIMVAVVSVALALALGVALVWARSAMIGAEPIDYPRFEQVDGRILQREEQPADDRVRLVLAARDAETGRAVAYRLNLPTNLDRAEFREGARIRLSARLMPPSPPIVPGAYNFARRAWFDGLSATGSVVGNVELVEPPPPAALTLASVQRRLSAHVRNNLGGTAGAIAATLASGDRGAIPEVDEEAIAELTRIKGIGRWSAEIYLLFAEGRTDIWPAGDLAVQIEIGRIMAHPERPGEKAVRAIAENWRPYRGAAAIFAWHHYKSDMDVI